MSREYLTKEQLFYAILGILQQAHAPLTRKQICDRLHMKKDPHVLDMLRKMVVDGYLFREDGNDDFGRFSYWYGIQPDVAKQMEQENQS